MEAKWASLPGRAVFDPNKKGLIRYMTGQEVAYLEVMGREATTPFARDSVALEQWMWRKGFGRDPLVICAKGAKPKPKKERIVRARARAS